MIIPETIEYVNGTYCLSKDIERLNDGVNKLNDILLNQQPRLNFRQKAEALLFRLNAKICAIKYFDGGYLQEDYIKLKEVVSQDLIKAEQNGYTKTKDILQKLLEVADKVHSAIDGVEGEIYRVRDEQGNPTTADIKVLNDFATTIKERAETLKELPDTLTLFGENVKMFDIKSCAINDLMSLANWADENIQNIISQTNEQFLNESLTPLSDQAGPKFFDYYPSVPNKEQNSAKAIIVLSPLEDEVFLFARAVERERNIAFHILSILDFRGKDAEFIDCVFDQFSKRNLNLIVKGFNDFKEDNRKALLEKILIYSKKYGEVIIIDDKGDRNVYDLAYEITKDSERLTTSDVLYKYLTMPNYNFVVSVLEERGLINGSEYAYVQNNMPFMGFVGFNLACSLHVQGKPWKEEVIELSRRHESFCQAYIKRLPSQAQLIDVGWKKIENLNNLTHNKKEIDYDSVKNVNVANVKKILELRASLFAKCGLVVKYCILAGDDLSCWERLDIKQREDRVNNATRLVATLLNCENDPQVQIIPKDEWTTKGAGGLCCDGGKRIVYREDCCNSVDWLCDAICHECYHSFQHTLQHQGWQEWHWEELGVTEYRVPEWDYNFERYKNSGTSYMIQVVESDARAFAKDCIMQSEGYWHLIDWE